jgi:nucleoid-associated protein YgaU
MKRYDSTQVDLRYDGKRVYRTTTYPQIEPLDSDNVVISNEADTFDNLAFKFYGDPTLWWIIALANGQGTGRMSVTPGIQLRVPSQIDSILSNFHDLNRT